MSDQEVIDTLKSVVGTMTTAVHILQEMREELDAIKAAVPQLVKDAKALEKVRKTHRQKMARLRSKAASVTAQNNTQNVTAQAKCDGTKEGEEGREEISPHTPFIGERGEEGESCVCLRAREEGQVTAWFAQFWADYPSCGTRKRDKAKCRRKFAALINDAKDPKTFFDTLMQGLDKWKRSSEWMRGFVCAPLVWLNNERWETDFGDDPEKADKRQPIASFNGDIRGNQFGSRDRAANYLPPTEADKRNFALPEGV